MIISRKDYEDYPSEFYPGIPYQECVLPKDMIDDFIKRVSSIDITEYIKLINESKKNVKPIKYG